MDSITDLVDGRFPSTRYTGSKRRLLPHLYQIFQHLEFNTAGDIFCGTSSVAYLLKKMGKQVLVNDYLYSNYWTGMAIIENNPGFKSKKPRPQQWYDIAIGTSQAYTSLTVSFTKNFIRSELYIPDNKELFNKLNNEKDAIEKELNISLNWNELPKAKASTITISKNVSQIKNKETWEGCFIWFGEMVNKFTGVFPKYL